MTTCDNCDSDRLIGSHSEFKCRNCGHVQPRNPTVHGNRAESLAAARNAIQAARLRKEGNRRSERRTA